MKPEGKALRWILLLWASSHLPLWLASSAALIFKTTAALADLGVALLIFTCLQRLFGSSPEPLLLGQAFWSAATAAAFPLQAFLSAGLGQDEAIALLLVLGAAWCSEFSSHPSSDLASALLLGLAALLKPWSILLLPLFFFSLPSRGERLRFALLALGLPALLQLPFLTQDSANTLWARLSAPASGPQLGLGEALRGFFLASSAPEQACQSLLTGWRLLSQAALLFLAAAALLASWSLPLLPALSLGALTLCLVPPEFPLPRLAWLVPLALFLPGRTALHQGLVALAVTLLGLMLLDPGALHLAPATAPARLSAAGHLAWALLNLALWIWLAVEWRRCLTFCLVWRGRLGAGI